MRRSSVETPSRPSLRLEVASLIVLDDIVGPPEPGLRLSALDLFPECRVCLVSPDNPSTGPGVRATLAALGIPASAYDVTVTDPVHPRITLRELRRPVIGGFQINFRGFVCTLGFNADDGTERSFITASHCTNKSGMVRGMEYYQPSRFVDDAFIGVEVEDPAHFRGGECPRGRKCRYSDAARALYDENVSSTRGAIARTSGANSMSIDEVGVFVVTHHDDETTSFVIGTVLNQVGRTTGWTQGGVTHTCVDINVFGSNITLLCQTSWGRSWRPSHGFAHDLAEPILGTGVELDVLGPNEVGWDGVEPVPDGSASPAPAGRGRAPGSRSMRRRSSAKGGRAQ